MPPTSIFPFFSAAENLERITPPELRFEIESDLPVRMGVGALIDYRLRLGGVPFRWRTEITEWDPPHAFTDVQVRGPYRTWIHTHSFSDYDAGTLMVDEVRYALPFWPLGELSLPVVRAQLGRIFRHRARVLGSLLVAE